MKQYFVCVIIAITVMVIFGISSAIEATENQKLSKALAIKVPAVIATSDENVYVVWGSNEMASNNTEIMFRA